MLDLLISYINFVILSIGYIVKRLTFFPPKPPHYISLKTDKEDEDEILFLFHTKKKKKPVYMEIKFKLLEYRFIKIINKDNEIIPLLLFIPPNPIPVCIIYSHGNSGDLGACVLEFYDIAINTNCLVVSFEYPGFGDCMNQPLRESLFYRNMKITYFFVRKILGFKPEQIILYGFSMGTGIMFDFACRKEYPSAGMILQSPFLSIVRTLYDINRTMYFDLFNNVDKAKFLKTKTYFIHGNKDSVVPYIHGRILAKLIPKEYYYDFLTVPNANHNNLFKEKKDYIFKQIREFIKNRTGYFIDFSKLNIDDSSNSTIDNNDSFNKINEEIEETLSKAKRLYNMDKKINPLNNNQNKLPNNISSNLNHNFINNNFPNYSSQKLNNLKNNFESETNNDNNDNKITINDMSINLKINNSNT